MSPIPYSTFRIEENESSSGLEDEEQGNNGLKAKVIFQGSATVTKPPEKAYISGGMNGYPDHHRPVFHAVDKAASLLGFITKNPAKNFGGDTSRKREEYMALDLQMVLETDSIILLPAWEMSEGSRVEATMAKALGHKFYAAQIRYKHCIDSETGREHEGTAEGCEACFADPANADTWEIVPMETPERIAEPGPDTHARSLVSGARNALYGPPKDDFTVVGRKWGATLSAYFQEPIYDIPADLVAVMLTDLKTSRQARTPSHYDSRVDIIGYQLCLDRIVTDDGRIPNA